MEEVPLVQVDRLALAFQYLRGNPWKKNKQTNKQKKKRDVLLSSGNSFFAKSEMDFLDECAAGGRQSRAQEGSAELLRAEVQKIDGDEFAPERREPERLQAHLARRNPS